MTVTRLVLVDVDVRDWASTHRLTCPIELDATFCKVTRSSALRPTLGERRRAQELLAVEMVQ